MRYINNYNYNTLIITEEEAKQARSLYCENQ